MYDENESPVRMVDHTTDDAYLQAISQQFGGCKKVSTEEIATGFDANHDQAVYQPLRMPRAPFAEIRNDFNHQEDNGRRISVSSSEKDMSTPDQQFYKQACNFGFLDHFDQNDKFDFCAAEEEQLRQI